MMELNDRYSKNVLVCPLDWGLGHATRLVPVISEFLNRGCKVALAVGARHKAFFRKEFGSKVAYYDYPGKKITFSTGGIFFLKLLYELPLMIISVLREHIYLKKIVREFNPDIIISDNRYGACSKTAKSIFVTHQLFIRLPYLLRWLSATVNFVNQFLISRFDACWIPDNREQPGLSGELSHRQYPGKKFFVGPLSRFDNLQIATIPPDAIALPDKYILVILSGPEPQRTTFENEIVARLQSMPAVIFRGLPESNAFRQKGVHCLIDHPSKELMAHCLQNCSLVISRSGYSTIMDLSVYGSKVVFIPTPGQPEQEYLAMLYHQVGHAVSLGQSMIHKLPEAIDRAITTRGLPVTKNNGTLSAQVEAILMDLK